jgi:hypothetical protein
MSPIPSSNSCTVWICTAAYLALISIAIGNCELMLNHYPILSESIRLVIVLLRLWVLWDRNRRLMGWTIVYYVLTQIGAVACSTISIGKMVGQYSHPPVHMSQKSDLGIDAISFQRSLHICIITNRSDFALLWAPGVCCDPNFVWNMIYLPFECQIFFEVMVFATACWNALERPRDRNSPFVRAMYRDGLAYFLVSHDLCSNPPYFFLTKNLRCYFVSLKTWKHFVLANDVQQR